MPRDPANRTGKGKSAPSGAGVKQLFDAALSPLTLFGVVVAAVVGAVTNWEALQAQYEDRPLAVGAVIAIAACLILSTLVNTYIARRSRGWLIGTWIAIAALVSIAYVAVVVYPRRCALTDRCGPSLYTPTHLNFLVSSAYALDGPSLQILNLTVDSERSTFFLRQTDMSIHAQREPVQRLELEFDRGMLDVFRSASCKGIDGEAPIEDALPVWRSILKDRGRNDLVQQLSDYSGYRHLVLHGGDHGFIDARPTKAELVELAHKKPEWYALIRRWLVDCVGVADPVLAWTLHNSGQTDLTISAIDYVVLDVGQVQGGGPDTLEPIDVMPHELVHMTGTQTQGIAPQIVLHPGNTAAVRILYRLDATAPGYSWLVRPVFRTLEGASAQGPELKIFAAKSGGLQ